MNRRKLLQNASAAASAVMLPSLLSRRAVAAGGSLSMLTATAPADLVCHLYYYAEILGLYKNAGLTMKVTPVANDPTALRGVLAGEADIGWCGALTTFQALRTGAALKVLSSFVPKLDYKLVAAKAIPATKDLVGQPVAVSQVGAVSQIVPKLVVAAAGGDASKVQWVSAGGGPNRFQALVAGRVQAAALNALHANLAAKMTDKFHVLANVSETMPDFLYTLDIVPAKVAQEKKAELEAFVSVIQKVSQWTSQNPKEAAALSKRILPDVAAPALEEAITEFVKNRYWSETGGVSTRAWNFTIDALMKSGDLATAPSSDVVINKAS